MEMKPENSDNIWGTVGEYTAIAAVCLHSNWRFFYDDDFMFILDWTKYESEEHCKTIDEETFRPLIVNAENAEKWMSKLAGELTIEQIEQGLQAGEYARLVFVIDFDRKLWAGYMWSQDQSALEDYQPKGWKAFPSLVYDYLPEHLSKIWDVELVQGDVYINVGNAKYLLIPIQTRADTTGRISTPIRYQDTISLMITIEQYLPRSQEIIYTIDSFKLAKVPDSDSSQINIIWSWQLGYNKEVYIRVGYQELDTQEFWSSGDYVQRLGAYKIR